MFTLRQLRYFEALAEALHFGRAARRLNISQPALSTQIAQLEQAFSQTLVERRSSGIALTPEGEAVLIRARRILVECRDLEALSEGSVEPLSGRLRLGIIASLAPYLLPPLLSRLETHFEGLEIGVRENVTASLLAELARGELDCVALALPVADRGIRTIEIGEDPFLVAVPANRANRFAQPVPAKRLEAERLILLEEGHCLRDQALAFCERAEARDLRNWARRALPRFCEWWPAGSASRLFPRARWRQNGAPAASPSFPSSNPPPRERWLWPFALRRAGSEASNSSLRSCANA